MADASFPVDSNSGSSSFPHSLIEFISPLHSFDRLSNSINEIASEGTGRARVRERDDRYDSSRSEKRICDKSSKTFITSDDIFPRSFDTFSDSIFDSEDKTAPPQLPNTKQIYCTACKELKKHTINIYSIHCKKKEGQSTYELFTCPTCKLQSSLCPNTISHGKKQRGVMFYHDNCILKWREIPASNKQKTVMKDPDEKLWVMECYQCSQERERRSDDPKKKALTIKWTRCNACNARYKKGKGVDALKTRDLCKAKTLKTCTSSSISKGQTSDAAAYATVASSQPTPAASRDAIQHAERMLKNGDFAKFPQELRMRIVKQCGATLCDK